LAARLGEMEPSEEGGATWDEMVEPHFRSIDEALAVECVPIPDRVFRAADLFVRVAVLEVANATLEDYPLQPWFKGIYATAEKWYRAKYGDKVDRRESWVIVGALLYSGAAFELLIPAVKNRVEEPGKTAWFSILSKVMPDEDPLKWILLPPRFSDADRSGLIEKASFVASRLRRPQADLMTAQPLDWLAMEMTKVIIPHLENSAAHLVSGKAGVLGLACWEAHQAAEKAMKVLLRQKTGQHSFKHDLMKLREELAGHEVIAEALVDRLPSGKEVIAIRANETPIRLDQAFGVYNAALELVWDVVGRFEKKFNVRDASFRIRKAPWLPD
jgi:hypothetical protein